MCVAIIKPAGRPIPSDAILEQCASRNRDGGGFAIALGDRVLIKKGLMTITEYMRELRAAARVYDLTEKAMLLHFRIGTHGSKSNPVHTHPFPLADNYEDMYKLEAEVDYAVVHNGIISRCIEEPPTPKTISYTIFYQNQYRNISGEYYKTGGGYYVEPDFDLEAFKIAWDKEHEVKLGHSDTMDFIKNVIYPFVQVAGPALNPKLERIAHTIMGASRVAMLAKDGSFPIVWGDWVTDNHIQYSNESYKVYYTTKASSGFNNTDDDGLVPINGYRSNKGRKSHAPKTDEFYITVTERPKEGKESEVLVSRTKTYYPTKDFISRYARYVKQYEKKDLTNEDYSKIFWYLRYYYNMVSTREEGFRFPTQYPVVEKRDNYRKLKANGHYLTYFHPCIIQTGKKGIYEINIVYPTVPVYVDDQYDHVRIYYPETDKVSDPISLFANYWNVKLLEPANTILDQLKIDVNINYYPAGVSTDEYTPLHKYPIDKFK